jgi:chemosensory pili system protein ChpC
MEAMIQLDRREPAMNGTPFNGSHNNGMPAVPAPEITQLSTLLIPVSGRHLVLPNVTVAEIIPFREPTPALLEDVPNWFLGHFEWRSSQVPLVSFEAINDEPFAARGHGRRIAILNNVTGNSLVPFCGLVTEGLPRLLRLLADEIGEDNDSAPGPAEIARVYINGERATVPNVGWIQEQLLRLR